MEKIQAPETISMRVYAIVRHASVLGVDVHEIFSLAKKTQQSASCGEKDVRETNKLPIFLKSPVKQLDNSKSSSQLPPSAGIQTVSLENASANFSLDFLKSHKQYIYVHIYIF